MKILAIDPGNEQSAYVVWDGSNILKKEKADNDDIITNIYNHDDVDLFAIEMVASYGMAVGKTVFETCVWTGRFIEAWEIVTSGCPHKIVYRRDVKIHHCNSMKAKDSNIRQALIDRFEPDLQPRQRPCGILKGVSKDIWSALAIATYIYDTNFK